MSEDEKLHIAKMVNRMVAKTLGFYMGGFLVLMVLMFGWHQDAIKDTTKAVNEIESTIQNISNDFGASSQSLHKMFPDELSFESNYMKYVIKRGVR